MLEYKSRMKPLGVRRGSPPRTTLARPHEQLTQNGPPALREELYERTIALPGVVEGSGRASMPLGIRTFLLEPGCAGDPPRAFLIGNELADLHPDHDGSMHLTLPRSTSNEIVA